MKFKGTAFRIISTILTGVILYKVATLAYIYKDLTLGNHGEEFETITTTFKMIKSDVSGKEHKNRTDNSVSYKNVHNKHDNVKDTNYLKLVKQRNKERLARVQDVCRNVKTDITKQHYMRSIMDPAHQFTYCRVNKVASTYTLGLLTQVFNCSIDCLRDSAERFRDVPYEQWRKKISNTFKFTFVREPYGRLFSTYSNKFYFPKENWAPIGPKIVQRYREHPSKDSLTYGHNITFVEMIRFTVEEYEAKHVLDEHLRPMHVNCYLCEFQYDFIGKLETLTSDWDYLKYLWTRTKKISEFPKVVDTKVEGRSTTKLPDLKHVGLTLNLIKDSTISRYKLFLRAWTYYKMSGIIYKHINFPFTEYSTITMERFTRALNVAVEESKQYYSEVKAQKMEAMKQAYDSIPMSLLQRLKKVVEFDCMLYDYDSEPDWLFDRTSSKQKQTDFNYFIGLE